MDKRYVDQARLHADIRKQLTGNVSVFLLSLHDVEPDFDLIGLPRALDLPAVRWKLLNLIVGFRK